MAKKVVTRIVVGDPPERRRKGRKPKRREVIKVTYKPKAQPVTRGAKKEIPLSIHAKRKKEVRAKVGGVSFADIARRTLAKLPKIGGGKP